MIAQAAGSDGPSARRALRRRPAARRLPRQRQPARRSGSGSAAIVAVGGALFAIWPAPGGAPPARRRRLRRPASRASSTAPVADAVPTLLELADRDPAPRRRGGLDLGAAAAPRGSGRAETRGPRPRRARGAQAGQVPRDPRRRARPRPGQALRRGLRAPGRRAAARGDRDPQGDRRGRGRARRGDAAPASR